MRITRHEVISFFATAAIFSCIFYYLLGAPALDFSMGGGSDGPPANTATFKAAQAIDNLNGVNVYYNGKVSNVMGRNVTADGYNLGLKYQCVEFIKRYYYEYYDHKMPNSYGHAKDFINHSIADGMMNRDRGLRQFTNGSISRPRTGDIMVFGATPYNKYGHIGIVSKSGRNIIEMIHQNPGPGNASRVTYKMQRTDDKWYVQNEYALGWLRRS